MPKIEVYHPRPEGRATWWYSEVDLQKSACDEGVKNELRLVLAKIGANVSFPGLKMRLADL